MNKKYRMIKIIGFLLALAITLSCFSSVFRFKYADGIYSIKKFYSLPKHSVDVLVLGSSHAFIDINPAVLFSEYGITAYVLGGSVQPMWNTYFYLCEALKTQSPKAVVLEAYTTTFGAEYIDESRIIKNTYGMKMSPQYWKSIKESAPKEEFWDYFLKFTRYHNRYTEISKEDFTGIISGAIKGFFFFLNHTSVEPPADTNTANRRPLTVKTVRYFRLIIELCAEKNIPLNIIVTPYSVSSGEQEIFNTASDIAAEYGVPFTNYNNCYTEFGFDYSLDMADPWHANYKGSEKITRYLGAALKELYDIDDNWNNPKCVTWQRDADFYWQRVNNQRVKECTEINQYLEQLHINPHYIFIVSSAGEAPLDTLNRLGIDEITSDLIVKNQGETIIRRLNSASPQPFIQLGSVMVSLDKNNNMLLNGKISPRNQDGINLLIYDPVTDSIVDNVTFDTNNNLKR